MSEFDSPMPSVSLAGDTDGTKSARFYDLNKVNDLVVLTHYQDV